MPVEVRQPDLTPLELIERVAISPVLNPLATAAIIFIVAMFILLQQADLRDRMSPAVWVERPAPDHGCTRRCKRDDAQPGIFLTQLAINGAFGLVIGLGLFFIGIPSAALWGVLAALLRFVPYIGAFMAGVVPVALGAAVDPGWTMMIAAAALFLVVEPVMGQVVEPMLAGAMPGLLSGLSGDFGDFLGLDLGTHWSHSGYASPCVSSCSAATSIG